MKIKAYKRKNGKVGIRNKIVIMSVDECLDGIARSIASEYKDIVIVTNHYTCMYGGNEELVQNMIGIGKNPNVSRVLLLTMGCGSIDPNIIGEELKENFTPCSILNVQEEKGTLNTIAKGKEIIRQYCKEAKKEERTDCDIADLIFGVKCGGSDTSSGLASNPSVGKAADKLIDMNSTVVVGELIELVGCEKVLCERAINPQVAEKIDRLILAEEARWNIEGADAEIMSIGNSVGGLTTIEEKSLGAVYKTGTKPVQDVLEFNHNIFETPKQKGLYLSEVTHLCGGSGVNFAAVGANIILWTTGSAGFENPIVPTIRVSGNTDLINDDIDIDASRIIIGETSIDQVSETIIEKAMKVANGEKTAIEDIGYSYMSLYQKDRRLESYLSNENCVLK